MTGFCVEKIAADERLRPAGGILRSEELTVISDARVLAGHIVQEARDKAEGILAQAQSRAKELEQSAESQVFERASELLAGLDEAGATVADRVAGTVVDLVMSLFDRLLLQTTPRKRIEASLKRLLRETPPKLMDAVLRVHPDDVSLLPEVDWEVKRDDMLARGACRLEAASGEWHADFDGAVNALRNAFYSAVEQSMEGPGIDEEKEDEVSRNTSSFGSNPYLS
jgi:flagellar biosynthesis/type III secretory pathway protein FliH